MALLPWLCVLAPPLQDSRRAEETQQYEEEEKEATQTQATHNHQCMSTYRIAGISRV